MNGLDMPAFPEPAKIPFMFPLGVYGRRWGGHGAIEDDDDADAERATRLGFRAWPPKVRGLSATMFFLAVRDDSTNDQGK